MRFKLVCYKSLQLVIQIRSTHLNDLKEFIFQTLKCSNLLNLWLSKLKIEDCHNQSIDLVGINKYERMCS